MDTTDGRRDWVRQTLRMMRFVKPAEKETFRHADERWMWPLKSDGSQIVTSAPAAECTSSLKFVVRAGVNFRHCDGAGRRQRRAERKVPEGRRTTLTLTELPDSEPTYMDSRWSYG